MQTLDQLLSTYSESHRNSTNKLIHWICVPAIMFSLLGLLMAIPFPSTPPKTIIFNWAFIALIFAWVYYLRLSALMFFCFVGIGLLMLQGNLEILHAVNGDGKLALVSLSIFALAWVGQFIGHHIEGKKPSFLQDLQFLLIGPAWLLHFIFIKLSVKY